MNKGEIIKYLKEKIKTNQSFIKTIKKVINNNSKTKDYMIINSQNDIKYYEEIINYIEEKDKVINEAIEFIDDYKSYEEVNKQVKTHQFVRAYEDILDEENIAKLLEILERGKNGKLIK